MGRVRVILFFGSPKDRRLARVHLAGRLAYLRTNAQKVCAHTGVGCLARLSVDNEDLGVEEVHVLFILVRVRVLGHVEIAFLAGLEEDLIAVAVGLNLGDDLADPPACTHNWRV